MYTYFKGLAGYPAATATKVETPATPVKATAVETDAPAETPAAEEATPDKKVKDAARNAVGKVKGLFKKKKCHPLTPPTPQHHARQGRDAWHDIIRNTAKEQTGVRSLAVFVFTPSAHLTAVS